MSNPEQLRLNPVRICLADADVAYGLGDTDWARERRLGCNGHSWTFFYTDYAGIDPAMVGVRSC